MRVGVNMIGYNPWPVDCIQPCDSDEIAPETTLETDRAFCPLSPVLASVNHVE